MAIVNGTNYAKMYVNEPKEIGAAGLQHTELKIVADVVTASTSDACYIGELPVGARLVSAEVLGAATLVAIEDEDGNVLAIGDVTTKRIQLVAVPAAGVAAKVILVKYLQC